MRRLLVLGLGFEHGGIVTTFKALLPALRAAGYEVRILAPYADEVGNYDIPKDLVVGAAFPRRLRNRFLGRLLRTFHWLTRWRFGFVFARQFPHDAFLVYGASLAPEWVRYSSRPTWGILHSVPHMRLDTPLTPVIIGGLRRFSRLYARVFAATPPMRDAWRAVGIESEVLVMPDPFLSEGAPVASAGRRSDGLLAVVCVGRLSWEKGQDILIAALAETPNVRVTFVGEGDWQRDLERIAASLGVRDRIVFAGWSDRPLDAIARADLLVNCSRTEAGSLSIREAFLCGVPVLATDCPGNRWSLQDGDWGRIVAGTPEAMAEGLRHACADYAWCLPSVGFAAIRESLAASQRKTLELVRTFDWTKERE